MSGLILGTAGHVDHGKTSLVRALTGHDLDALPEEQERGITIVLGFVGAEISGRQVSFVDVPGHESLVRTMVAGAAGIDAVLLCVSAVDGVMPQTIEHLGICDSLGITQGLVVLTMADQVDAELLELAEHDVADLVKGTFLAGAPCIPVSSLTGTGLDALRAAIGTLNAQARPQSGPFRLSIDRVFSRPGFGTVVTGTAASGTARTDATLWALPADDKVRIRGMQVHNDAVDHVVSGQRVAINLAGVDRSTVRRGVTLASRPLPCTRVVDVSVAPLPRAPALADGDPVRVLLGTSEAMGHIHLMGERDSLSAKRTSFAQLRLDTPLVCLPGDRFVLRRPSPEVSLAGGQVLDPWAPRLKRKERRTQGLALARLAAGDRRVLLERAGENGLSDCDANQRGVATLGILLGDRRLASSQVGRLEGRLLEALAAFHQDNPLVLGAQRRALHGAALAHLSDRAFEALVVRLVDAGLATVSGPVVRLNSFSVALNDAQTALTQAIVTHLRAAKLDGMKLDALVEVLPDPDTVPLLHLLQKTGRVAQIASLGWYSQGVLDTLVTDVRVWFASHSRLDAQAFKQLTGQSRRTAIPLLEWLDARGITVRQGDARTLR